MPRERTVGPTRMRVAAAAVLAFACLVVFRPASGGAEGRFPARTSRGGGDLVAFYSERDGNAEIYVMNVDGSDRRRLTSTSWNEESPSWSPDGRRILYTSNRGGRFQAWAMNADGSDQRALTDTSSHELASDWSPDGTRIVFYSSRHDRNPGSCWPRCTWQLYVMSADGSNQRRLVSSSGSDQAPRWSPDGSRLVFWSIRGSNWDIYTVDPDGSGERRLTSTPEWEALPAWSPDGSQIAYCSMTSATMSNRGIGIMNADGTGIRTLIPGGGHVNEDPAWAPDGTRILFQSNRTGTYQIFVMNADGTDQRNISRNGANEYWPAWRPAERPTPPPTVGSRLRLRLPRSP